VNRRKLASTLRDRSDIRRGRFLLLTDAPEVFCGVCGLGFRLPASKAKHLRDQHAATVSKGIVAGNEEYLWER